jgi:diguanylate cyclase (GGDEF)-like protein
MEEKSQSFERIIGKAVMDEHYNFNLADNVIYEFLGDTVIPLFTAYIHPDDRQRFIEAVADCSLEEDKYVTVRLKSCMGEYCLVLIFVKPSSVDPDRFFELDMYDMLYLVDEYKSVSMQRKKLANTLDLMCPVAAFDYTPETDHLYAYTARDLINYDGSAEALYKYLTEKEIIDRAHFSTVNQLLENMRKGVDRQSCNLSVRAVVDSKEFVPVTVKTTTIYDKATAKPLSVVGVVMSQSDVAASDKAYRSSNLDPLTGLYNKAAIKETAINMLSDNENSVISYVVLDLDHFKEVNDTYGHMFGDEVIFNVARIIKEIVGKQGYVGRIGGDEFFIALKGVGSELEELRPVLRSIRSQIEWAYKGKLGSIKLTTSIGCANYPKDADNYDDLFKLADRCLYIAKAKGRNRFIIYTKEIHGSLEDIKAVDNSIKMSHTVSLSQKLDFVADAVTRLNDWKRDAVNPVLRDMLKYFKIGELTVYDVAEGKGVYSAKPIVDEEDNICNYFDSFRTVFREGNILAYGDSLNLKMPYPDFYEYAQRMDYRSLFIYAIKDKGNITHIAAAYVKGSYEKWSDTDTDLLSILFKTIGDKILHG